MANFASLDDRKGLLPWEYEEHRAYVLGRYGSLKGTTGVEAANDYIEGYAIAEKAHDEAYEAQRERLRQSAVNAGGQPQELPDPIKLSWDPRIIVKEEVEPIKEIVEPTVEVQ